MKTRQSKKYIFSILFMAFLVCLDQYTKYLSIVNLREKNDIILIPGVLQLHYLENTGAAFSMLEGGRMFFAILTPILVIVLLYIFIRMPQDKKFNFLSLSILFLVAGAVGNYIDRILNGYVVDFIYFSLINFPVFNVADCYVTVSVFVLMLLILFYYKDQDLEEIKRSLKISNGRNKADN
ncbi:MAG: signal peptidase II [Pseudobutyrivibrio sp.]|nr:signal peptidase II [Pseudobutyrivibrio sp.]